LLRARFPVRYLSALRRAQAAPVCEQAQATDSTMTAMFEVAPEPEG